jgi:NAD kinase
MWPGTKGMVITPLSARSFSPIVVQQSAKVGISIDQHSENTAVMSLDGRRAIRLLNGARVMVSQSPIKINFLIAGTQSRRHSSVGHAPVSACEKESR